jgi:CRISPR-associated endonuclease/helicase Cas3
MPSHDRTLLDERLLGLLGPGGSRNPTVIVATQTAEQSLDIDADLLITDACPADVLLQRLGRLHRHRTGTKPTALVIDPGEVEQYIDLKGQPWGRPGQGWAWIYRNLLAVDQTMAFIRSRGRIVTPRDCRELVESATHAEHLREIAEVRGGRWVLLWRTIYGEAAMKEQLGAAGLVDWSRPYADAVINNRFATRLGDGTIDVMCSGLRSPLDGAAIGCLPVPARWLRDVADGEVARVDGDRIFIGGVALRYDVTGLHRVMPQSVRDGLA